MGAEDPLRTEAFWLNDLLIEPDANRVAGVHADPKAVEVLLCLSSSAPATVSTQVLLEDVWGDVVVGENSLHQAIASLRKLLGDNAKSPTFIETIPRKGYRIVATVTREQLKPNQSDASVRKRRRVLPTPVLFSVIALSLLCLGYFLIGKGASPPSIAVLPFADMSPNGDQEYFGDGIAEELLNELVRLDGLRVAGRTSSFSFKGSSATNEEIAEELNVTTILEGSVRKSGRSVRVTAQLVNAADGFHLWSETFDRELADIFEIQEEIARSVTGALGVKLGVGGVNAYRGAGTRNIDAYEAVLQGLRLDAFDPEAIRLFERAIELDPNYSAAWSELASSTMARGWVTLPGEHPELVERAHAQVLRALELDPDSATSISRLGWVLFTKEDWIGFDAANAKAISLLPDRLNLVIYASGLMRLGRSAAAQELWDKAIAVEPWGGRLEGNLTHVAIAQRRFADAKEVTVWASSELFRNYQRLLIALNEGDPKDIKAAFAAIPPGYPAANALYSAVLNAFDSPELVLSTLRAAYADNDSQWPSKRHDIALFAAYFGDPEFALESIKEAGLQALWYPVMADVRKLPGFKALVTELKLDEYWRAIGWADLCRPLGENDFECS